MDKQFRTLIAVSGLAATSVIAYCRWKDVNAAGESKPFLPGYNLRGYLSLLPTWLTSKSHCHGTTQSSNPVNERGFLSECHHCGAQALEPKKSIFPRDGKIGEKEYALQRAVSNGRRLIRHMMLEQGIPGAIVSASKDGETVWNEGIGLADVENDTPCTPDSIMRIASISKPLTAIALLQLYQKGLVDLDAPIQTYLPEFPSKSFDGEPVDVTVRLLLSHLAGIRHYQKITEKNGKKEEFENEEYYIKSHYSSIQDSIKLFSQDDLVSKPGSDFNYTTHGWTLISGVIEKVSGKGYLQYMREHIFDPLGMTTIRAELHPDIIYGRAKHYVRNKKGVLQNVPYVDLSYKWAGGGFISNSQDLVKFGNAVLTSWQIGGNFKPPCILDPQTTTMMLKPAVENVRSKRKQNSNSPPIGYGMGWFVRQGTKGLMFGKDYPMLFSHTGGAVGASSVLTIIPDDRRVNVLLGNDGVIVGNGSKVNSNVCSEEGKGRLKFQPQGVVVAVIFNLQEVKGVFNLGVKLAEEFHRL